MRLVQGPAGITHELFFTHYEGHPTQLWSCEACYTVQVVRTTDWRTFSAPKPVTPTGFVSPDAPVEWRGATLLAFQAYPDKALGGRRSGLFFSRWSASGRWSAPRPFLQEVLALPWNDARRAIDPTLVMGPDGRLHCFFVGSSHMPPRLGGARRRRINLLGHAATSDPQLRLWTILTKEAPLLGASARAPDGVENVAVFRRADGLRPPSRRKAALAMAKLVFLARAFVEDGVGPLGEAAHTPLLVRTPAACSAQAASR